MNLRQLEAFRATYLTGSVSRAAEVMYVSQPSVSRLIRDLETSVGFRLFDRTARGLNPTSEARQLYAAVERSFQGIAEIRIAAESIRTRESGEISLGVIPALAYSVVPSAITVMRRQSSDLRLDLSLRTTQTIVDEVETDRRDLGLISPIRDYPNVVTYFCIPGQYVCLLPPSHRLAGQQKSIDLFDLVDDEFVTFDTNNLEYIVTDRETRDFMQSRSHLSTHSAPVHVALAQATGAVAIVDPFTATQAKATNDLVCKAIEQDIQHPTALIGAAADNLSLAARDFVEILESVVRDWSVPVDCGTA